MALIQSYEKSGNLLFRYRGVIPVFIMLLSLPILLCTNEPIYKALLEGHYTIRIVSLVLAIIVSLCGLALRAYTVSTTPKGTSGRNTQKQVAQQLNTTGIYSVVRHPLYLANYLIWAGILISTMNIWAFIIVSLVYWIYYERIMFAEEAFLRQQFGDTFENWAAVVPAFIPKFSLFKRGDMQFSWKTYLRREYATTCSTIFSYVAVDYVIFISCQRLVSFNELTAMDWIRPSLVVMLPFLLITLLLSIIKHHTSWLKSDKTRD